MTRPLDPATLRAAADVVDSEVARLRALMDRHMHTGYDFGALMAYKHIRRRLRAMATRIERGT